MIVTASPETLVAPIAQGTFGADLLIGTRLAFDSAGRVTGGLDGENCRGPEKVCRLRRPRSATMCASRPPMSDTDGDRLRC